MPLRESMKPNAHPEGIAILASIVRNYGAEPYIIDLNGYRINGASIMKVGDSVRIGTPGVHLELITLDMDNGT